MIPTGNMANILTKIADRSILGVRLFSSFSAIRSGTIHFQPIMADHFQPIMADQASPFERGVFARGLSCALICMAWCAAFWVTRPTVADDFNVRSLPGLQWWASAADSQLAQNSDGTGAVASGDPVGFISDLSGHGHNAVMGNSVVASGDALRPHFQASLSSGSVGILFDGTNYSSLQDSLVDGASGATLAFAIGMANSNPSNQFFLAQALPGPDSPTVALCKSLPR